MALHDEATPLLKDAAFGGGKLQGRGASADRKQGAGNDERGDDECGEAAVPSGHLRRTPRRRRPTRSNLSSLLALAAAVSICVTVGYASLRTWRAPADMTRQSTQQQQLQSGTSELGIKGLAASVRDAGGADGVASPGHADDHGPQRDASQEIRAGYATGPESEKSVKGVTGTTVERVKNSAKEGDKEHASPKGGAGKPNVFFFLIDDMGYGDIGYQSTDLKEMTPNLDALAADGIKLTNYYSMDVCTPARGSLMTGRYAVRLGMQYSVITAGAPWGLPLTEKIMPEYMNDAGYESHMVGKWHLGMHVDEALPSRRGFKSFMGYLNGEEYFYSHKSPEAEYDGKYFYDFGFGNETDYYDLTKTNHGVACSGATITKDDIEGQEYLAVLEQQNPADACYTDTYSTDAFLGRARQIVKSKTPVDEEPLFLYIAHQSVHTPVGPAPAEGFTADEMALLAAVAARTTTEIRVQFAAVLLYLDKRIGEFVEMLEAEGWLDNSIIVVASDNGGCPSVGGSNYPLRGTKLSLFEGGTKVPAFVWSRSHIPEELWGTTYDKLMHVTDWVPTLASATDSSFAGSAGPLDGIDQWDSLVSLEVDRDSSEGPRTEMLYNWNPYVLSSQSDGPAVEDMNLTQGAFREGKWKLLTNVWCSGYYSADALIVKSDPLLDPEVICPASRQCEDCCSCCSEDPEYLFSDRLFDLESDPREAHDVMAEYPEIADRLRRRAHDVIMSEWTPSHYLPTNTDSYAVWAAQDWWMVPWVDKVLPDRP